MSSKARLERVKKALRRSDTPEIFVVWSEEERQALIEKYGEDGWIDVNWDDGEKRERQASTESEER